MIIRLTKGKSLAFAICTAFCALILLISRTADAHNTTSAASYGTQLRLPIVMYHQVMSNERRAGKYILSIEQLENDLKYLSERGYTTVDTKDLVDYVYNGVPLPKKSIMLTFDDGFESVYALVAPLLEKYEMCCVTSIIGSVSETFSNNNDHNLSYSYLSWDEIATLSEGETVEIQNHSYDMHYSVSGKRRGMGRISSESDGEYLSNVKNDIELCQNKLTEVTGISPCAMVYPLGRYNSLLEQLVKDMGFKVSLVCEERINTVVCGEPDSLFGLGRYNRPSGISSENFFMKIL